MSNQRRSKSRRRKRKTGRTSRQAEAGLNPPGEAETDNMLNAEGLETMWAGEPVDTLCIGCDLPLPVNDLGLCRDCNAMLDRDMIRDRDWERSETAAFTSVGDREELRRQVIARYGAAYELIEPPPKKPPKPRRPR